LNNPCGSLLTLFGSLFLGEELMSDIESYYASIQSIIELGEVAPSFIEDKIDEFSLDIDQMIDADNNTFNSYVEDLKRLALSQMFPQVYDHPCGRFLLSKHIGSDSVVSELQYRYGQ
jgi:hypothetical protein